MTSAKNLLVVLSLLGSADARGAGQAPMPPAFDDVKARTQEFMGYEKSIRLTPQQQAIKQAALRSIPAPCCKEYSIATCCCPCNLAKSIWGLANYAVARLGYDTAQTKALVLDWLRATNPSGYSGDSATAAAAPSASPPTVAGA